MKVVVVVVGNIWEQYQSIHTEIIHCDGYQRTRIQLCGSLHGRSRRLDPISSANGRAFLSGPYNCIPDYLEVFQTSTVFLNNTIKCILFPKSGSLCKNVYYQ